MLEAIEAKIGLVVVITEGVPVQDTAEFWAAAKASVDENGKQITRIIGPNCPGIITPEECLVGITPANITGKGKIGLVSKSGTLTYQMMFELADIGFTTAIGIGGDPIIGTTHIDALEAFEADPETEGIVMIGEIGGDAEERAPSTSRRMSPSLWSVTWLVSPLPKARPWATLVRSSQVLRGPHRRRKRPWRLLV